ncbi:MAG: hypothetical protein E7616_02205 [Ruminococcaceae bacterium]|nr:hypothetical protein [Oscillospiraceae bacterium]
MSEVSLKGWHAEEIRFINKVKPGTRIQLEHKFQYNVKYAGNNLCQCELTLDAQHKESPDMFGIHAVIIGLFSYKEGTAKENIHIQTYKELFPFARAMLSGVTVNAGIPPIIFPMAEIEKQNIIRFDMNGFKGDKE